MATQNKSENMLVPQKPGMLRDFINRLKLILRLMGDRRVSPLVKLIPVGALLYWISPVDILMGIPGVDAIDDAAILWFGSTLFVELCPSDVVQEHMKQLTSNLEMGKDDEVVDGESTDVTDRS